MADAGVNKQVGDKLPERRECHHRSGRKREQPYVVAYPAPEKSDSDKDRDIADNKPLYACGEVAVEKRGSTVLILGAHGASGIRISDGRLSTAVSITVEGGRAQPDSGRCHGPCLPMREQPIRYGEARYPFEVGKNPPERQR